MGESFSGESIGDATSLDRSWAVTLSEAALIPSPLLRTMPTLKSGWLTWLKRFMADELRGDDFAWSGEASSFVTVGAGLSLAVTAGRVDSTVAFDADRLVPPTP
jgi:hypothetical protein